MPDDPITSQSLLARVQGGDRAARNKLVTLYLSFVQRWMRILVRNHDHADELAQDTLVVLLGKFKFSHPGKAGAFRGWLLEVIRNKARAFWRNRKGKAHGSGLDDALSLLAQLEDPHSDLTAQFDAEHNHHILAKLTARVKDRASEHDWKIFERIVIAGEKPEAVAESLGTTIGAIYQAKGRVMLLLRTEGEGLLD